jgi:large subunit ribosomal protein L19
LGAELLSLRTFSAKSMPVDIQANKSSSAEPVSPSPPPWTPTGDLHKRKTLPKRMGHLMQMLEKEKEQESLLQLERPEFGPGDLLELKLSVPENKRRATVFKGICIARRNRGWRTSFTVRNFIGSSGGIERSFPL